MRALTNERDQHRRKDRILVAFLSGRRLIGGRVGADTDRDLVGGDGEEDGGCDVGARHHRLAARVLREHQPADQRGERVHADWNGSSAACENGGGMAGCKGTRGRVQRPRRAGRPGAEPYSAGGVSVRRETSNALVLRQLGLIKNHGGENCGEYVEDEAIDDARQHAGELRRPVSFAMLLVVVLHARRAGPGRQFVCSFCWHLAVMEASVHIGLLSIDDNIDALRRRCCDQSAGRAQYA